MIVTLFPGFCLDLVELFSSHSIFSLHCTMNAVCHHDFIKRRYIHSYIHIMWQCHKTSLKTLNSLVINLKQIPEKFTSKLCFGMVAAISDKLSLITQAVEA